jgi:3-deoxy-D-manno-octulosonate 8-phosphate phosphatase (KDO 8-P phosphatase)
MFPLSLAMPAAKSISLTARLRRVKLFLTDVDGVMTDGTVLMGPGLELKQYDIQDGLGIVMLRHNGIKTGWVSARPSEATVARAQDLKIDFLLQPKHGKVDAVEQIITQCGLTWADACFVGDDVVDIGVFRRVGLAVAVANARPVAKAEAHLVTKARGGHGAVRELIEKILIAQGKWQSTVAAFAK